MTAAQLPRRDAPVLLRVDAPMLNVIIDAHLALAPLGLLRTMRLARTTRVWLPRSLWSLLDNDALYRRQPERLSRRPQVALASMAEQMPMWRQAWHYGRLAADVHWIGDACYEGSAPERGDPGLFQRFEACRAGLDCAGGPVGDDPLGDCARDAAALAAALQPDPFVILAADGDGTPPVVGVLAEAGLAARAGLAPHREPRLAAALVPGDAQTLAAIDLVAPGALALGDGWALDGIEDEGAALWRDAYLTWRPLLDGAA